MRRRRSLQSPTALVVALAAAGAAAAGAAAVAGVAVVVAGVAVVVAGVATVLLVEAWVIITGAIITEATITEAVAITDTVEAMAGVGGSGDIHIVPIPTGAPAGGITATRIMGIKSLSIERLRCILSATPGVGKAVIDSVKSGVIPKDEATKLSTALARKARRVTELDLAIAFEEAI